MRLALSSAVAPGLGAADLFAACARRGIAAVELVQGDAHGVAPDADEALIDEAARQAQAAGVRITAFRSAGAAAADAASARLSARLGAPVVAPPGALAAVQIAEALPRYAREGGRLLLAHGSDPAAILQLRDLIGDAFSVGGLAWELAPAVDSRPDARAVLAAAGPWLGHIRLLGGGPEAAGQEGTGIGELAVTLALSTYRGVVALAPSTTRYLTAWRFWLGRRGWGCGSAAPSLAVVSGGGGA